MDGIDVWPEDVPALASGISVVDGHLHDEWCGRTVKLGGSGAFVASVIDGRSSVDQIVAATTRRFAGEPARIADDVYLFLTQLDAGVLLAWRSSWRTQLAPWRLLARLQRWLALDWPTPLARRIRPTLPALVLTIIRANALLLGVGLLVSVALAMVLLDQNTDQFGGWGKVALAGIPAAIVATLVAGLACHEGGHLLALRRWGHGRPRFIVRRGLRVSIAHQGLTRADGVPVALAGPVAGVVGTAALAVPYWLVGPELSLAVSLTGLLHLYSLLPWTADGRMIWHGPRRGTDD